MKKIPSVIIIGRPNVGKSTLFNKMTGGREAIVHDQPGVTRDLKKRKLTEGERSIELIDTGGILPDDSDLIPTLIREKVYDEINYADLILFVVDVKTGLIPIEEEIAARLRETGKKIVLVGNKADDLTKDYMKTDLYRLGFDPTIFLSAEHSINITGLKEAVFELTANITPSRPDNYRESRKIAIIGKPNVGKSTLVNSILKEPRMIVSNIPGTTRDVVDVQFNFKSSAYTLLDTGGIRKKSKIYEPAEIFSVLKARKTIQKADIVFFVLSAEEKISHQDISIAKLIHEQAKSVFIILNKWDLVENPEKEYPVITCDIYYDMPFMDYAPVITTSGLEGKRITRLINVMHDFLNERSLNISTPKLNRAIKAYYAENHPPAASGKKFIKFNYATQVSEMPCRIIIFTNRPKDIGESYKKYLIKKLRQDFDLSGIPVHLDFRHK